MSMKFRERLAAARAEAAARNAKDIRPYKFPEGKTLFRIISTINDNNPNDTSVFGERRYGVSYIKSFDEKEWTAVGDRYATYNEEDPIRNLIFQAMQAASGNEDQREHFRKMLANPKIVFNAVILNDPKQSPEEPVLIEVSEKSFDSQILSQFEIWLAEEDANLADQQKGQVFLCERVGTGVKDTRYTFNVTPKKLALSDEVVKKAIDLDAWIANKFGQYERKAVELIGKTAAAAGIQLTLPAAALTDQSKNVTPSIGTAGAAAVTHQLEDDDKAAGSDPVEDDVQAALAAIEEAEVVEDTPPFETDEAKVDAKPASSPQEEDDIEAILASLDN